MALVDPLSDEDLEALDLLAWFGRPNDAAGDASGVV
jgi:hypothetical protein